MPPLSRYTERVAVGLLLIAAFWLRVRHVGHKAITYWDESFHALVARNLLEHPLKPTLIEHPFIPYDYTNWGGNHIWVHKPMLPLWEIMLSYALLGINTFALRFPSVLLATGAILLTYLIGRELLDKKAAFVAAAVQALNPAITMLVHGYLYSDHIDVNLLFYVELGIYFVVRAMRTGAWRDVLIAGVAQGLAFLSKSYLAAIVLGVMLAAWLLPYMRLGKREESRVRGVHVLGLLAATLLVIAPWSIFAAIRYPQEFWYEHLYVWLHLNTDIEAWGAPWDRLIFDYSIYLHYVLYTPVIVATFILFGRAVRQRDTRLWIVYAWGFGVLIPHILSTTKTPSATVFGLPPFWLLLGAMMSEAMSRNRRALSAWGAITAICLLFTPTISGWGRGYPDPNTFGAVMATKMWVVWHVVAAFGVVAAVEVGERFVRRKTAFSWEPHAKAMRWAVVGFGIAGFVFLGGKTFRESWKVTERNQNAPTFSEIAAYARENLPENAVLIHEWEEAKENWGDFQLTTFLSYRTGYTTKDSSIDERATQVIEGGGVPYLVTHLHHPLPILFTSKADDRTIYELDVPALNDAAASDDTSGLP